MHVVHRDCDSVVAGLAHDDQHVERAAVADNDLGLVEADPVVEVRRGLQPCAPRRLRHADVGANVALQLLDTLGHGGLCSPPSQHPHERSVRWVCEVVMQALGRLVLPGGHIGRLLAEAVMHQPAVGQDWPRWRLVLGVEVAPLLQSRRRALLHLGVGRRRLRPKALEELRWEGVLEVLRALHRPVEDRDDEQPVAKHCCETSESECRTVRGLSPKVVEVDQLALLL